MDNRGSGFQICPGCTSFVVASAHSCSSGPVFGLDGHLYGWLIVTRLSQLDLAELTDLVDTCDISGQSQKRLWRNRFRMYVGPSAQELRPDEAFSEVAHLNCILR